MGERIGTVWRTDVGLTALLVFLVVMLLIAPPLMSGGIVPPVVFDVLFSLIIVSGALAVSTRRSTSVAAIALGICALSFRWLNFGLGHATVSLLDAITGAVALLFFAALVLGQVLRAGPITLHRVRGAMAAYLLFGLAWSAAYQFVLDLSPSSFRLAEGKDPRLELVYFSFVTLTTVGYGDITPLLPAARSLAMAEALVGQLFPAVLIGRLVGMELSSRGSGGGNPAA
jgi:hypothetical protein